MLVYLGAFLIPQTFDKLTHQSDKQAAIEANALQKVSKLRPQD